MERITDQERIRPWTGLAFFAVIMILTVTVCGYMQLNWGIPGVILTELIFAACAVLFCVIRKVKIREVFPVKKISAKDIVGCICLLIGVYSLSVISITFMNYISPAAGNETAELSALLYGKLGLIGSIIVIGLLPAVGEELVYRGVILSTFRSFKKDWMAIVAVGLLFSINHLSILRSVFTLMLGMALAYVVVKRNNILLSILMHFMINSFSAVQGYLMSRNGDAAAQAAASVASVNLSTIAGLMTGSFAAPFFIVVGMLLISKESHKKIRFVYAAVASAILVIGGIGLNAYAIRQYPVNLTYSYITGVEGSISEIPITLSEDGEYNVHLQMNNAKGNYVVTVYDDNDDVVCATDLFEGAMTMDMDVIMEAGDYRVLIEAGEGSTGENPHVVFNVH